jgi:hypothetical protein
VTLRVLFELGLAFRLNGNYIHEAFRVGVVGAPVNGSESCALYRYRCAAGRLNGVVVALSRALALSWKKLAYEAAPAYGQSLSGRGGFAQ